MTYVVGSPEWLAERATYLGASEMAGALGLSPWDDPISVWERKIGEAPEKPESFRMKLGTLIEPIIGKLTAEQLGAQLRRMSGPRRHPAAPYLASNPDFELRAYRGRTGRGLVQAKLSMEDTFGEPDAGEGRGIPLHYRLQGLGELMTTGFDYVIFAALNPRSGVELYPLDRRMSDNEEAISDLFEDTREFWLTYVEPKRVPPPSGQSSEALRRRYPDAVLKVGKIASAEQSETLQAFLDLKAEQKKLEALIDDTKNTIKAWIGDAAWIEGAGKRFSWPRFDKTTVAWEEIAKGYRTLLEEIIDTVGVATTKDREALDAIVSLYTRTERSDGGVRVAEIK